MTKEQIKLEAKRTLDSLGVELEEITDDIAQEIVDWKTGLDTETRREDCGKRAVGKYFLLPPRSLDRDLRNLLRGEHRKVQLKHGN